ncbi:MAG: ribosomal protein [Phycisphaerales bacterium]|nr:ribosomal protein [Phycisphaerales bacterium]
MDLVVEVYKATACFPAAEVYGLTNQLRRAAVSVPSNIAEGQGRGIGQDFSRFLRIAQGSLQEMETQMLVASRLSYIQKPQLDALLSLAGEVGRLNRGLQRSLA